jgi:hypothetical protein
VTGRDSSGVWLSAGASESGGGTSCSPAFGVPAGQDAPFVAALVSGTCF